MQRLIVYAVATFCGTGYAPLAPATVASFAFMLIWGLAGPVPLVGQLLLLLLVIAVGVPAATYVERREGKDPHKVVSDEVAGMIVTYLGVSTGWTGLLVGFLWFRVFDIGKPWPVRSLERLPEGWGITADDLMAGVYANLALRLTLHFTGW
jgi:phosphatidylglycerophosphatase A